MDKAEIIFEKLSSGLARATGALKATIPELLKSVGHGSKTGIQFYGKEVAKGLALPGAAAATVVAANLAGRNYKPKGEYING